MPKLSYSLRKYDYAMYLLNLEVKRGLVKVDPVIGEIQSIPSSHGGIIRQVTEPKIVETSMKDFSAVITIQGDWLRRTDVDTFTGILWENYQVLISQMTKYLFEILSLTTDAVGNVVNAKDMNIWDAQIEAMKQIVMRFDEEGNHSIKCYANPKDADKYGSPTKEQKQKLEGVIKAKREEYYAKKRTRRLS